MDKFSHLFLMILSLNLLCAGDGNEYTPHSIVNQACYNRQPVISDLDYNPAVYVLDYKHDYTCVHMNANQDKRGYKRYFDPDWSDQFNFSFQNLKVLDDKSWLLSTIVYYRLDQYGVDSSLEQDYYGNYLSVIDSTKGNTTFQGPEISVAYIRKFFGQLSWSLNIDYAVQRGLKDRFTSCLTIDRFTQGGLGLGYTSDDNQTTIGADFQYHSQKSEYEAVDYIFPAYITQYWGYFTTDPGTNYTKMIKIDDRKGYDISFQIARKNLLIDGLELILTGSGWGKSSDVVIGSKGEPHPYGYWVREGLQWTGLISYDSGSRFRGFISAANTSVQDWVEATEYSKLVLENSENNWSYRGQLSYYIFKSAAIYGRYSTETDEVEYVEYLPDFKYSDNLFSNSVTIGINWNPGLLTSIWCEGSTGKVEPDFHWEADELEFWGLKIGVERQYTFGILGVESNLSVATPTDEDLSGAIQNVGISLYVKR